MAPAQQPVDFIDKRQVLLENHNSVRLRRNGIDQYLGEGFGNIFLLRRWHMRLDNMADGIAKAHQAQLGIGVLFTQRVEQLVHDCFNLGGAVLGLDRHELL